MSNLIACAGGFAAVVALTASASADLTPGLPVVVPSAQTQVTVTYQTANAWYLGALYFLGTADAFEFVTYAPDTGEPGLGMFLFTNHNTHPGYSVTLDGLFDAGDILLFAYDILEPEHVSNEVFRGDLPDDQYYFAYDPATGNMGIEDLRLPNSDLDFDDILFNVSFTVVPGPASLALLALAALWTGRRRRSFS